MQNALFFATYGAEEMTDAALRKAYAAADKRAQRFEDRHGPLVRCQDRAKANAYRWELATRKISLHV